MYVFHFVQESG